MRSRELSKIQSAQLGLALAPAAEVTGAGEQGVAVVGVVLNGSAAEHGVEVGDVILDVGGKAVSSPSDVRKDISALRREGRKAALMRIKSGEAMRFVALPLGNSHA